MIVLICEFEVFIPAVNSLKAKRQVVRSIIDRIKARCNASVAEVDMHDLWQRAVIGIAVVGNDRTILQEQVNRICAILDDVHEVEICHFNSEFI